MILYIMQMTKLLQICRDNCWKSAFLQEWGLKAEQNKSPHHCVGMQNSVASLTVDGSDQIRISLRPQQNKACFINSILQLCTSCSSQALCLPRTEITVVYICFYSPVCPFHFIRIVGKKRSVACTSYYHRHKQFTPFLKQWPKIISRLCCLWKDRLVS